MIITHDLAVGGLQQVVVTICKTIDRNIFEPSVLCLRATGEFASEIEKLNIKILKLPQKHNKVDYFAFFKVAKILRQLKIDIIHTHNTQPFIDGTIGALLAGVKTRIHTDHARSFPDKRRYMCVEWVLSHFVSQIVAVSTQTAENLANYEKISPEKIMVIPNGIDGKKYSLDVNKEAKRSELGINDAGPIIGTGVRLCEQKGLSYLLRAIPAVCKVFPDCTFVIAGSGPLEKQLKALTYELGINSNVKFIGMRMDIPELLKLYDCYVLPSLWEGLPMVLLEAMAAKCPVIATQVGGIPSIIHHNKTGILIRAKSETDIAHSVIDILSDVELRNNIVKNAFRLFSEQFDAVIMTQKYASLYLR
jgi:glycosyltransferase involved in cell wall biosynthesis